ncbi:hypothetical protein H8356DRAFT_937535 [Neocallimastix lanati (nom. inval.)]|nr:hypothetical protein H8356DRAFT_937535 [Neocallimastix sp. JGI-2020a]
MENINSESSNISQDLSYTESKEVNDPSMKKDKSFTIPLETTPTPVISNSNIPNTQLSYNENNDIVSSNVSEESNNIIKSEIKDRSNSIMNNNNKSDFVSSPETRSVNSSLSNINTMPNYKKTSNVISPNSSTFDGVVEKTSIPPTSPISTKIHTPFYQTDLCNQGDERADAVVELLKIKPYQDALSIIIHHVVSRRTWGTPLEYKQHLLAKEFHELVCEVPSWVDWNKIRNGQKVFWRYAWPLWISCIGSAMTRGATLPIPSPNDNKTPNQRLLETSQFLLECMYPDSLKPGNFGWSTAVRIRCAHALARLNYRNTLKERINNNEPTPLEENLQKAKMNVNSSVESNESIQKYEPLDSIEEQQYQEMLPVSQADLIRTILYLSLGSMSAMKRGFGIRMEKGEKEDYTLLWRYIAFLCGIDNQNNPLISLREAEVATIQLINTESCMFLDDNAIRYTQAVLQAMARLVPIFGYSNFIRALTNEMACRLMGNEVVSNMRLKPKPNEYHRQIVKWFIQYNRLVCRGLAKSSFGQSIICTINRLVVPKVVWFANSGKWVDYSRGVSDNKQRTPTEDEKNNQNSSYRSGENSLYKTEYSPSISESSNYNKNRRSQIRSIDSTLVNEFIGNSEFSLNEIQSEVDSQCNESIMEDEEWVQKPLNSPSKLKRNVLKRNNYQRPQSWSIDNSSRYSYEITESDSVSQRRYSTQSYISTNKNSLSKNERSIPYPTHWFENIARLNMWAVVPAMSVAMAAYCVVLVYID